MLGFNMILDISGLGDEPTLLTLPLSSPQVQHQSQDIF